MSDQPGNRVPEVIRDQRGRFRAGVSGNPSGRSRSDLEVNALLARLTPRALEILGEMMENGNLGAAKAIVSLGVAPPRSRPVRVEIGRLRSPQDCLDALDRIGEAVSSAEIAPGDAAPLVGIVQAAQKVIETADLAERLAALEQRTAES